jgi:hypothetical protein
MRNSWWRLFDHQGPFGFKTSSDIVIWIQNFVHEKVVYTEAEVVPCRRACIKEYKKYLTHIVETGEPLAEMYAENRQIVERQLAEMGF